MRVPLPEGFLDCARLRMQRLGLNNSTLAELAECSSQTIGLLLEDEASFSTAEKVSNALGMPVLVLSFPGADFLKLAKIAKLNPERYRLIVSLLDPE